MVQRMKAGTEPAFVRACFARRARGSRFRVTEVLRRQDAAGGDFFTVRLIERCGLLNFKALFTWKVLEISFGSMVRPLHGSMLIFGFVHVRTEHHCLTEEVRADAEVHDYFRPEQFAVLRQVALSAVSG